MLQDNPLRSLLFLSSGQNHVKLLKQKGERFVSSTQISKEINIDASQIAKDL